MADKSEKEKVESGTTDKKKKKGMGCLIVLLIMTITPVLVLFGIYQLNREFKLYTNSLLSMVPGKIGDYFESQPTRQDELKQVRKVSDYLLELDDERAVDKLKVIEKENTRIYNEIIKDMLRINPNRTRNMLSMLSSSKKAKDTLGGLVDEIETEKKQSYQDRANYIQSLPINSAIEEMIDLTDEMNGHKEIALIMELVDVKTAVKILYQLPTGDRNRVFTFLSESKKDEITSAYATQERTAQDLKQMAQIMKNDHPVNVAEKLTAYSQEDQAVILHTIGPRGAGEILSKYPDQEKAMELISSIKDYELSQNISDDSTEDLLKALKVYRSIDDNTKELVNVYLKMSANKVAEIVREMLINQHSPTVYELKNGDDIVVTDEQVIVNIFQHFPPAKKSEILSILNKTLSTEVTKKLILPK